MQNLNKELGNKKVFLILQRIYSSMKDYWIVSKAKGLCWIFFLYVDSNSSKNNLFIKKWQNVILAILQSEVKQ